VGGIIGKLTFDRDVQISPATTGRMIDAVAHRGRGSAGTYHAPGIALAWCDVAASPGTQVARNETGSIRAVADAQLTNAAALRRQLERLGHFIDDPGDAELIAHAYEQWGDGCIERLNGPFACAIWDEPHRRLLLARDHVGIRPLCFALLHGDGVVFASEIKALLQDPSVGREWNPEAVDAYLALGYVPSPVTMYRRVSKLEPAHTLVVEGRRLSTRQYWDFPFNEPVPRDPDHAFDLVESQLRAAVGAHLRSGAAAALHSGGLASSAIVATLPRDRAAIAVGVEHSPADLVRIAETARHLGVRSEIDLATPEAGEVGRLLAFHLDEPAADPAAIAQFAVFVAARRHVDVALAGHGAAALWAGYARHRIERLEAEMRSILVGPLARLGGEVGRALGASIKGARALAHLAMPAAGACATKHSYGLFDDEWRHRVYTRTFAWQVREANPFARHLDLYARCASADPLTRALYVDARTYLPDSRLMIADRASAAASLQLRYPFLDRDLVEIAAGMPNSLKLHGGTGMYALRQVASRRVPSALLPSPRRVVHERPWLATALSALVPQVLLHERFDNRGIFSRPALKTLWDEHRSGRRNHAHRLWSVLMLEFWFREFIDGDAAAQPAEYALLLRAA
jgi:asparagine synthase (glutamine-hydrolysing)